MRYVAIAESRAGMNKKANQDSLLVKHATYGKTEILMAIICDGMGGLVKGEVASAAAIDKFDEWFSKDLPHELQSVNMDVIGEKWSLLLKTLNEEIKEYGLMFNEKMGTTFTGVLFINEQFVLAHVGDTRFYHIGTSIKQISEDHTFVAREMKNGRLTPKEAKKDKRKNMLLQCIGASERVSPQIFCGVVEEGAYLLCTDGFRHKISENEICDALKGKKPRCKWKMRHTIKRLIALNKMRDEHDDISAILISAR